MSTMCLLLLVVLLAFGCYSNVDLSFQVQPQPVRINNLDELYITRDDHYIGQVLYRYDQIQLACECQSQVNHTEDNIYWTINNKTLHRYNNSRSIQLVINTNSVQAPITYVTCHCVFIQINSKRIKRNYQYQLYIDLESEPSLKPIKYSVPSNMIEERFYDFIHRRYVVILSLILIPLIITCPLIALSLTLFH